MGLPDFRVNASTVQLIIVTTHLRYCAKLAFCSTLHLLGIVMLSSKHVYCRIHPQHISLCFAGQSASCALARDAVIGRRLHLALQPCGVRSGDEPWLAWTALLSTLGVLCPAKRAALCPRVLQ